MYDMYEKEYRKIQNYYIRNILLLNIIIKIFIQVLFMELGRKKKVC